MNMRPQCLSQGDTIGLVAPCHVAERERYAPILDAIRSLGFQVRLGDHFFRNTYGYLASEEERAEDINSMAREKEVKMVLFGGGEGGEEVLPYLDYSAIRAHPKFYVSYSDGTSILSAITRKTGLVTYYGALPGMFENLTPYN
ncbi:MAG: LD-carboxypeptidase, partial [Neglectibacter sp.]